MGGIRFNTFHFTKAKSDNTQTTTTVFVAYDHPPHELSIMCKIALPVGNRGDGNLRLHRAGRAGARW